MCDEDEEYIDEEDDELFSIIPPLPDPGDYERGESEYGDLDDEDFDIGF